MQLRWNRIGIIVKINFYSVYANKLNANTTQHGGMGNELMGIRLVSSNQTNNELLIIKRTHDALGVAFSKLVIRMHAFALRPHRRKKGHERCGDYISFIAAWDPSEKRGTFKKEQKIGHIFLKSVIITAEKSRPSKVYTLKRHKMSART